ncbi:MAG TPA: amino acid adenylation domain-containing protein [Longimicrobiaceae bacterium]|jgi:amino acid adenylation domain-containing protein|nr:amino acid adenylation domain-containing protein [Longimicrobiaceae bacterium]
MSDLLKRLAELSPEKRRLLELRLQMAKTEAAGPAMRPRAREGNTFPLSFAQQRLWLVDELEPGSGSYNIPLPVRMRGPLRADALERTLDALRERHESLRTTLAATGGEPVQVVHPHAHTPLPVVDLSALPAEERDARAAALLHDDANTGFDLREGPLFRASLLRLGAEDHLLLLNMHHIVSDGWSMGVLTRELGELYAAFAEGRPNPLAPLPVQYADFALWQREHLRGEVLERDLAFWRERLAGAPPVLELPTDRARPSVESHRGATYHFGLSPELTGRIRDLVREEGSTLFATLLGGLKAVLGRHAGQDDVVVGTPVANRSRAQIEGLIGFFVNTLALRTDLSGDPTFRELVRREKEGALSAFSHQDLPFERVVEELKVERDLSRNPVFQAVFVLQNAPGDELDLAGVHIEPEPFEYVAAKFDLTLTMQETAEGGVAGAMEYATDLFDPSTVERLTEHFVRLLDAATADPDRRLSELAMLGEDERERVVRGWNATESDYPRDSHIAAVFAETAALHADAVALTADGEGMTYAELDARSSRLARHLQAAGVAPGGRVGLSMERSADLIVSLLAIVKAGGAYVPLDPAYPAERLAWMLEDSAVAVLIVPETVPEALSSFAGTVVSLANDRGRIDAQDSASPEVAVPADSAAYVVYTSGSTGRPKGVVVPHRAVLRLVRGNDFARLGPDEVFLQLAPVAFDASTLEVWGPLLNGSRIAVFPPHTPSLEELGGFLLREGVTTAWLTSGLFHQMVDGNPEGLAGVRQLMTGGDVVSIPHVRRAMQALPGLRLCNMYGPTENTTFTTFHVLGAADVERASLPIGRPIRNTRVYVLDTAMRPVPVGVPGELYIGGDGLAHGYLNRPELTAEKFVADPFSASGDARLYRSGDRVRWLEDGTLEFLGRIDEQVKIRGFRIELGEVEAALCAHPGVREASVIAREDGPGGKRLVAYVVPSTDEARAPGALRAFVQRSLPDYMVPSAFVAMDALPLTANGKVDRRALPAPDGAVAEDDVVAPRGPVEEMLAGVWAEVLRADRVSATANFFEMGGHSLLATQVVSRIRQVFRVELPLRALFEAPTVRDLALRVEQARASGEEDVPPIVAEPREGAVPLSFSQERLWFLDQLEPGGSVYNMPLVIDLAGPVDVPALESALGDVVRRHEALRSTFAEVGGQPVQMISPADVFHLPVVPLDGIPDVYREGEVERLVSEEARLPFDLERGPLVRARLLRVEDEKHVLLLTMHHIVSDGWSLGIIFREMTALYAARLAGEDAHLPPPAVQYGDFAVWQRRHVAGERLERQIGYWRERLKGAPATLELPTDHPRPPTQSFRGDVHTFAIPAELAAQVRELSRREGATLFMTLLAAFQVLLARYARQTDVVVGSPIAGRNRAEVEGLVGFFVNTLALRGDLSADPGFRDLVAQARETTLGAYTHQDLPFEKLVEEVGVERSQSYTPIFQVMFALQNAPAGELELSGVHLSPRRVDRGTSKFDLTLDLQEAGDEILATFEYALDLFDPATIERMGGHFRTLLGGLVAEPDRPVSTVEILSDDEERLVVHGWNGQTRRADYRRDVTMHGLFEAQAERTPDAAAVVFADETLTYAELNDRANRLAHYLRRRGVGPEVRVGILMERSAELIVAMYGVLKAGAAYVPLDPAYPAERVAFMLEDTAVPVLITQERLVAKLPETAAEVLPLDANWETVARESGENPEPLALPENLAYLIYTSGSTGRPKGVQLEHRGAAIVLQWMRDELSDDLRASVLASTSVCFDVSIAEIFGTLSWGGKIVVVKNALSLANLPEGQEVFMASMVPSAAAELLRMHAIPATLRSMNLGGEPVKPSLSADLYGTGHIEQVINLYGPSEDTTYTTYLVIPRGTSRMTVGRPVANTQIHILDRHFRPCPVGVPGELYIGGHGVTRGYHARPGMTAEKYLPNPYGDTPGERMYRTGDLARYLPDGEIEYLGRLDHQIKIRGHRVEIGEVEAVLAQFPGLEESAVVVREDAPGVARLVAYYVPAGAAPTVSALRMHVRERLPEYMVPAAWVRLAAMPHTPNGKVDRRSLPAPDAPESEHAYVAPRTPSEQVLASVWAEVLGMEKVGLRDSFFELGGHSLLATQVMSRIREAMQVELPLRALFDAPTVEGLAERVDAARREARGLPELPIVPVPREGELPLSFAQERLWFLDRMQGGSAVYNMPFSVHLVGALDVDALRGALSAVAERHETLRTTFGRGASGAVQVIHPPSEVALRVEDFTVLPSTDRHTAAERLSDEEASTPFDLATGPLLRARLVKLGDEEHMLALTMHHIVSDGWSLGIFFRDLVGTYRAFADGEGSPLSPLGVQYADFAVWQRNWLQGETLERQLGYWRDKLAGVQTLDLPTDRPRPAVQSHRGDRYAFGISQELAADLEALSRREGVTLFMTLLTAFKILLFRYAGQEDVVVGSPIAGRNRAELEEMVGFFVNTLGLRTDMSGDPEFVELLRRVRETTLDAYAHQDLPFERLVEEMKVERSLARHPIFQVSFSLQNAPVGAPETPGLRMQVDEGDSHTTKFDLTLGLTQAQDALFGAVEYSTDLFDKATIERMTDQYRVLLTGIVAGPNRRLSELPRLLDETERHRVLVEWNRTGHDVPAEPVHRLFAAQARRTPDATALVFEGETISFAELDARANKLAHFLIRRGVGLETRVALHLDRSPAMVVAMLAVFKAGAAYVPLDPAYPADRLQYMLEDADISLLLTHTALRGQLPAHAVGTVALDAVAAEIDAMPSDDPSVDVDADTLAYVIYTSGSTGRPKGVMVTHRGIPNLTAAQRELFDVRPDGRVLQFASFSFDAAVSEVFSTLLAGAALVLAPRAKLMPGAGLEKTLRDNAVTGVTLPPSVLAALHERELPALRTVIAAGEACSAEIVARWADGRRFCNAYGPTETTVGAAIAVCTPDSRRPPIGPPLWNTRAFVLDTEMLPVSIGVAGELYVGGTGVARGYHGQPGLTAERFVPDPFSGDGARLYRTGDRVRWRRDGEMEFLGRMDEQIKIRGFRIEPGEVESLLTAFPGVRHALVMAREDVPGSPRLVAYVAAPGTDAPSQSKLRAHLKERMPDYMVPSAFIVMDDFPLSPNGKVDRRALPAPDDVGGDGFVAPQGEMERTIAGVWQEMLHLKSVGVNDNFFEIGGHSLLLTQMHERLREVLGRDVSMIDLFQYPTVSTLAQHLAPAADGDAAEVPQAGKDRGSARRAMLKRKR